MGSNTEEPAIVRVSQKGQATIPKPLREKFGIDAPGEVLVYEEAGRIVVEPIPTMETLAGIHADDERERGTVLDAVRDHRDEERERERSRADRLRPEDEAGE